MAAPKHDSRRRDAGRGSSWRCSLFRPVSSSRSSRWRPALPDARRDQGQPRRAVAIHGGAFRGRDRDRSPHLCGRRCLQLARRLDPVACHGVRLRPLDWHCAGRGRRDGGGDDRVSRRALHLRRRRAQAAGSARREDQCRVHRKRIQLHAFPAPGAGLSVLSGELGARFHVHTTAHVRTGDVHRNYPGHLRVREPGGDAGADRFAAGVHGVGANGGGVRAVAARAGAGGRQENEIKRAQNP